VRPAEPAAALAQSDAAQGNCKEEKAEPEQNFPMSSEIALPGTHQASLHSAFHTVRNDGFFPVLIPQGLLIASVPN